jgi:hypothetical protein
MGVAINEKIDVQIPTNTALGTAETTADERWFRSNYYGIGVAISVSPMIRFFGEYVYNYSNQENNMVIKTNAVHIGAWAMF